MDKAVDEFALATVRTMERVAEEAVTHKLGTIMAAALADPDVDEGAKSLAGYVLKYLEDEAED